MFRFLSLGALLLVACVPDHAVLGRAYEVRVPSGYDGKTPLPLIVMLHGYGVTGRGQDILFPVSGQVDAKQFLYALPNGTVDRLGKRFWDATEACCNFEQLPVDDVAFFRALVEDVKARYPVKPGAVFLVGHSNGAFMSLRLACDASDVVTGVVAVSGSTFEAPRASPKRPATSTIAGEKSVEITRPSLPTLSATRKPSSPVPDATSRMLWPGCGSRFSTSHAFTGPVTRIIQSFRSRQPEAISPQIRRLCSR